MQPRNRFRSNSARTSPYIRWKLWLISSWRDWSHRKDLAKFLRDPKFFDEDEFEEVDDFLRTIQQNKTGHKRAAVTSSGASIPNT